MAVVVEVAAAAAVVVVVVVVVVVAVVAVEEGGRGEQAVWLAAWKIEPISRHGRYLFLNTTSQDLALIYIYVLHLYHIIAVSLTNTKNYLLARTYI